MKITNLMTQLKNLVWLISYLSFFFSANSLAHGRWLLPSHTNISGNAEHVITLDMAISNDLFQGHYGFIQASQIADMSKLTATPASLDVILPDGVWRKDIPFHWLKIRSSGFDTLTQTGTHHYVLNQPPVYFVIFKDASGKLDRRFGKLSQVDLPSGAEVVSTMRYMPSIHTFVSRNALTKPHRLNKGLELIASNHPNDLFAGESAQFEIYFSGKPLNEEIEVQVVKGNTRYRNERNQQTFNLKNSHKFTVNFAEAGMYLIEAELKRPSTETGIELDRWALFTTLEVSPE
ncbi:DUF4198 domain-containing protein [Catenovulum maritimum]|uniref:DUF4198 domain-containing protein n=1 Tax=Catenovulum maritimum TaxID=1513271 RepID=A0A0J8GTC9_9ALTE|nr:DUF4198 domain-containing protein [Catenovulum maritimum]KMT63968.1 hypothetical protein XM47_16795 [Catenovulum maritimum]